MPDDNQKNPWSRLVDAAKDAGAASNRPAPLEPATSGFVAGVIAMREGLWRFARTILWRRWSLLAALGAIVLYLAIYLVMKSNPPKPNPAPVPAPSLPPPPEP